MVGTPVQRFLWLLVIGTMLVFVLLPSSVGATPDQKPVSHSIRAGCGPRWHHVSSPSPGTNNSLEGVSGVSQDDAWAVGEADQNSLALPWNGQIWTRATTPQRTKSETSSDSVHPVTTAITEKMSHWSRSFDSVSRASFQAAIVMIPMTAAPTP